MRDRTAGAIVFALVLAGPTWAAEPPGLSIGSYEKGPHCASATAETRAWPLRALVVDRTLAFGPVGSSAGVIGAPNRATVTIADGP